MRLPLDHHHCKNIITIANVFYRLRVCLSRRVRRAVDVRRDAAASRDARAQHDVRQPQRRDVRHLAGQEVRLHVARFAQSEFPAGAPSLTSLKLHKKNFLFANHDCFKTNNRNNRWGWHGTEVAFALLTQQPQVRFSRFFLNS